MKQKQKNIIIFFLKSYYNKKKIVKSLYNKKKHINKQLYFWFQFKNHFFRKLHLKLKKFPKMGILSSHYVHILSKKNITYQVRSKYRSKIVSLNYFNYYMYMYTKFIYIYIYNLNSSIFFFSSNSIYKNIWSDSDFYVNTSQWHTHTLNVYNNVFSNIIKRVKFCKLNNFNVENYNNEDVVTLYNNKHLIDLFFTENDNVKKELLLVELAKVIPKHSLDYIYTMSLFIKLDYSINYLKNFKHFLMLYVQTYKYI